MSKTKLIIVAGPTASGKTALAVHIAKKFNAEVVSADSMQIYKEMNIATAKPTIDEMEGIQHHMIDFLSCDQKYSVADYLDKARPIIAGIIKKGKNVVVAGGTGLYINSLVDNIVFDDTSWDEEIRKELEDMAKEKGANYLHNILNEIDPDSAVKIHENNVPRVIRAIEYNKITGKLFSVSQIESKSSPAEYDCLEIGINYKNRQTLYDRINKRVDIMVDNGLIEETRYILGKENLSTSAAAIGYKEIIPYFAGEKTLTECLDALKQNSRRYAKRQLTWFRKRETVNWFYADEYENTKLMYERVDKLCSDFLAKE